MIRALALLCALAPGACARGAPAPGRDAAPSAAATAAAVAGDTLRGTVAIVGSEPGTWAVLQPQGTVLNGDRRVLESLNGIEVVVFGERSGARGFVVRRLAVRAADGVAAVDGVLRRTTAGYALETADGVRIPLRHVPEDLRGRVGARVWLAGPLDRPPDSFGVIAEPAT